MIKLGSIEFQIPDDIIKAAEEKEKGWICFYYDFDKGILSWKIVDKKISVKEATSLIITGKEGEVLKILTEHKAMMEKRLLELERLLMSLEVGDLEDYIDELHTELIMEYDGINEEMIWLDKLIKVLTADVDEIEGFFKIVRSGNYEMLIVEEIRAVVVLDINFFKKLLAELSE